MAKASNTISFLCFLCSVFFSVFSCDTNREFEDSGIELSWTVCEFSRSLPFYLRPCEAAIENVKVCVSGQPQVQCVFTNSNGEFTLSNVPRHEKVLIELSHRNYRTLLVPVRTGNDDMDLREDARNSGLPKELWYPPMTSLKSESPCSNKDDTEIAAIALELKFAKNVLPLPINERRLVENPDADVEDPMIPMMGPVSGMKVSLKESRIKPKYTTEYGKKDPDNELDAIDKGYALFCNLPERTDYSVVFHLDNDDIDKYYCILADAMADRILWGFRTEDPYKVQAPVQAGAITYTVILCFKKENGQPPNLYCDQDEDAGEE